MRSYFALLFVLLSNAVFASNESAEPIRGKIENPASFGVPTEVFVFDCTKDQVLIGSQGTQIDVPANCFIYRYGGEDHSCQHITLRLQEFCIKASLVESYLTTLTKTDFLESSGAIHIEVWCADRQLELPQNKHLSIHLPQKTNPDTSKFQLYNRVLDDDGNLIWTYSPAVDYYLSDDGFEWLTKDIPNGIRIDSLKRITFEINEMGWNMLARVIPISYDAKT
ncbi:MAG: hypothetical protein ACRCYO_04925, partial [Bacteroidia bacterium]